MQLEHAWRDKGRVTPQILLRHANLIQTLTVLTSHSTATNMTQERTCKTASTVGQDSQVRHTISGHHLVTLADHMQPISLLDLPAEIWSKIGKLAIDDAPIFTGGILVAMAPQTTRDSTLNRAHKSRLDARQFAQPPIACACNALRDELLQHSRYIREQLKTTVIVAGGIPRADDELLRSVLDRLGTVRVTTALLRFSRIEKALLSIIDNEHGGWSPGIVGEAQNVFEKWSDDLGQDLRHVRADFFGIGGRLEGLEAAPAPLRYTDDQVKPADLQSLHS